MGSRIFSIPTFDKFAKKARLDDESLIVAVERADRGLFYADLGGGVIKQAIARPGESAIKGFRTIVGFKTNARAFFLFGFAKNESDNITDRALTEFRSMTANLLALADTEIDAFVAASQIREIKKPQAIEEPTRR